MNIYKSLKDIVFNTKETEEARQLAHLQQIRENLTYISEEGVQELEYIPVRPIYNENKN